MLPWQASYWRRPKQLVSPAADRVQGGPSIFLVPCSLSSRQAMRLVAAMREAGGDLSPNATSLSAVERAVARNAQMGGAAGGIASQVTLHRRIPCSHDS